jgi:hypothetical protein
MKLRLYRTHLRKSHRGDENMTGDRDRFRASIVMTLFENDPRRDASLKAATRARRVGGSGPPMTIQMERNRGDLTELVI